MKKLRIGVDIDSVVNDLSAAVLEVYNEDSGDNLTISDITDYMIEKFVKPEYKESFHKYFVDKRVWKRIKPINIKAVQWLIDNHDVYFVTATEIENLEPKKRWLLKHFTNIDLRKRLVRLYDKQLFSCDFLIDDSIKNLNGTHDYISVCIDMPYNQGFNNCLRFKTVQDFVDLLICQEHP